MAAKERENVLEFVVGEIVGKNPIGQFSNGIDGTRRANADADIRNGVISCDVMRNRGKSKEAGLTQGRLGSKTHHTGAKGGAIVMRFDDVMNGTLHFNRLKTVERELTRILNTVCLIIL